VDEPGLLRKSQFPAQQSLSSTQTSPSAAHIPAPAVQVPIGRHPTHRSLPMQEPEQQGSQLTAGLSEISHAPEQQSSLDAQIARSGAQAAAVSTQMPSSHAASATHGAPPLHALSISTVPFGGGVQVP